jgi:glutathione S-transferase
MDSKIQPKIILYRGPDPGTQYSWSPFVNKLEARLRFSNISYRTSIGTPFKGPKGKIPYITLDDDNENGIGDSSLITQHLISTGILSSLNTDLSPQDLATDTGLRALLEDRLYFLNGVEKWSTNYYAQRDYIMRDVPYPVRVVIGLLAYRGNMRKLREQGAARFSGEEILGFKREIWGVLDGVLRKSREEFLNGRQGTRKETSCCWVLAGENPTEVDACLYGFVASVMVCESGVESRELLEKEFPGVVEWAGRIHEGWFPEYERWT